MTNARRVDIAQLVFFAVLWTTLHSRSTKAVDQGSSLLNSFSRQSDATLPLRYVDGKYLVPVILNGQTFDLVLDAASSEIFFLNCRDASISNNGLRPSNCVPASSFDSSCSFTMSYIFDGSVKSVCLREYTPPSMIIGDMTVNGAQVFLGRFDRYTGGNIEDHPGSPLSQYMKNGIRYWNNTAGTLGMAPKKMLNAAQEGFTKSVFTSMLSSNKRERIFELDLTSDGQNSTLRLHDIENPLEWSFAEFWDYQYSFPIFHMKVCGVDLFANYSSHWRAAFDSGSMCLGLPETLIDMIEQWTNLKCSSNQCEISTQQLSSLPSIEFSLGEDQISLYISTKDLVLGNQESVCIKKLDPTTSGDVILFGNMVMQQFYIGFSLDNARVGLKAKKQSKGSDTYDSCLPPVRCIGHQIYYQPMNTCINPDCNAGFFLTLDENKTCRLSTGFVYLCVTTLLVFVVMELILFEYYRRVEREIRHHYPE